jgi:hypothetical protein
MPGKHTYAVIPDLIGNLVFCVGRLDPRVEPEDDGKMSSLRITKKSSPRMTDE